MRKDSTFKTSRRLLVAVVVATTVGLLAVSAATYTSGAGAIFVGMLLIPALVGGSVALLNRLARGRPAHARRLETDSFGTSMPSDVINFTRIRVAGLGGLGLIGVALALAATYTRIGETLAIGVVGGIAAAILVIAYRRHHGPLSSNEPGARAFLVGGDDDEEPTPVARRRRPDGPPGPLQAGAHLTLPIRG